MTMTLGFDVVEALGAMLGEKDARKVLVAIAKHSPAASIRAAHFTGDDYDVQEIDASGETTRPKDLTAIQAAIKKAGKYVDWPYHRAPTGVPPIILPGTGWDLTALLRERPMQKLVDADHLCGKLYGTDRARKYLDARGRKLLPVADKHRLVMVYR